MDTTIAHAHPRSSAADPGLPDGHPALLAADPELSDGHPKHYY